MKRSPFRWLFATVLLTGSVGIHAGDEYRGLGYLNDPVPRLYWRNDERTEPERQRLEGLDRQTATAYGIYSGDTTAQDTTAHERQAAYDRREDRKARKHRGHSNNVGAMIGGTVAAMAGGALTNAYPQSAQPAAPGYPAAPASGYPSQQPLYGYGQNGYGQTYGYGQTTYGYGQTTATLGQPPSSGQAVYAAPAELTNGAGVHADWFYCRKPRGYYPYVQSCPAGWRQVAAHGRIANMH